MFLGRIAVLVDAACCYRRSIAWYVGLSVTIVSSVKTAEPIEMPFGYGLEWAQGSMYYVDGALLPITIGSGVFAQITAECR